MKDIFEHIKLLRTHRIENKRVLLRVDFNVQLGKKRTIADDTRILRTIPTIELLLKHQNKVILVSHLNRPEKRDIIHSLSPIALHLQTVFPKNRVVLVDDFLSEKGKSELVKQKTTDILLLENIRFYQGEKNNSLSFAQTMAALTDVYINDAFGVSHRKEASIVTLPLLLNSYCGLLLEKEITEISKFMHQPKKPVVAIVGGAKISTKIIFLSKLIELADYLLLSGGLANTFFLAKGYEIGKSLVEKNQVQQAKALLRLAEKKKKIILLPSDVVGLEGEKEMAYKSNQVPKDFSILDIGPQTQAEFGNIIHSANTIIWNGPLGRVEDQRFSRGTDFLFYTIAQNRHAFSLVGGGDTLASVSKKEYLTAVTHISTGGGAMLEFIENGTLPGIEALKQN